jgi:cupin fold WbuC family metalloprotein
MIKKIVDNKNIIYAIIIKASYKQKKNSIKFFTEKNNSQQLGYMNRPKGYYIKPHYHKINNRNVKYTLETLVIKKGIVETTIFKKNGAKISACRLSRGDIIIFLNGGHSFKFIKDAELVEIKQGPYSSQDDKVFINDIRK